MNIDNETKTKKRPSYRLYTVTPGEDEKRIWTEVGAAWPHKDGKGFNLSFTSKLTDVQNLAMRQPKVDVPA